jgi:hypothetical protein
MGSMLIGSQFAGMDEAERVAELNRLIAEWREPGLVAVRPERVVPDTTNREYTGISPMHLHYIAEAMRAQGFTPRDNATGAGHDLPIVVRETVGSASVLGAESLDKWAKSVAGCAEFPPSPPWVSRPGEGFFCSLGNGHFFQALNLFGAARPRKFHSGGGGDDGGGADGGGTGCGGVGEPSAPVPSVPIPTPAPAPLSPMRRPHIDPAAGVCAHKPPPAPAPAPAPAAAHAYDMSRDALMRAAVREGVPCIVLRPGLPTAERKFISMMHNSTFEFRWVEGADGSVPPARNPRLPHAAPCPTTPWPPQYPLPTARLLSRQVRVEHGAEFRHFTGFDGMTKHADSWELDEIVKIRMRREAEGTAARCAEQVGWDMKTVREGGQQNAMHMGERAYWEETDMH